MSVDHERPAVVLHFSEDPEITHFEPHVPTTREEGYERLVWAIDDEHAPLYWFPRQCPRVTCWPLPSTTPEQAAAVRGVTTARRVHAIEWGWLDAVRTVVLYAYRFDAAPFEPWPDAVGHWVSRETVEPIDVEPVGDLLARHAEAGIELRLVNNLWPLHWAVVESGLFDFSGVRLGNALPDPRQADQEPPSSRM